MPNNMDQQTQQKILDLERDLTDLKNAFSIHRHAGVNNPRINIIDLFNLFQTVSVMPTNTNPQSIYDQVKVYVNGATKRFCVFDFNSKSWFYTTLT